MKVSIKNFVRLNIQREPSLTCYTLRMLVPFAQLVDATISLVSFTIVSSGFTLEFVKQLAKARHKSSAVRKTN